MPIDRMTAALAAHVAQLEDAGTAKGAESVVTKAHPPTAGRGPRFNLEGEGEREFIRMNSNSYLGLSLRPDIIAAEEGGAARFGAGPGAVRFISGTYEPHVALEKKLAGFHGREAGMIFSAAYATIMGTIGPTLLVAVVAPLNTAPNTPGMPSNQGSAAILFLSTCMIIVGYSFTAGDSVNLSNKFENANRTLQLQTND